MPDDKEDPAVKAAREAEELLVRIEIAKKASEPDFEEMLKWEKYREDKFTLLKARASELFKNGYLEVAASVYTRTIGMHACDGTPASHALYGNRSACRCGLGDYEEALADAEECIRLNPTWAKGYVRKGAALHGLFRLDEAVRAFEAGLAHDPTLAALTEGMNDALRRRKAMGGVWEVAIDASTEASAPACVVEASAQQQTDDGVVKQAPYDGWARQLLLSPATCATAEASQQRDAVLCIDGTRVSLYDMQRRCALHEVTPCSGGALFDSPPVAACCDGRAKDAALLIAESGPKGRLQRLVLPGSGTEGSPTRAARCEDSHHSLGMDRPRGMALVAGGAGMPPTTLYVCDSGNGRVLALDPTTLQEHLAIGHRGSGEGELETPVAVAAHGDQLAIADAGNYRVAIFTQAGAFVRHVGERASRFLASPRAGHFASPPAHVGLVDGHLFVLEGGGATHVHILDPTTGEAKGLLQPPFNATPLSTDVFRAKVQQERARKAAAQLGAGDTGERPAGRSGGIGCLTGMCVTADGLYVATNHAGQPRILRLPRVQPSPSAGDESEKAAMSDGPVAPAKELAYKKGFLLEVS